MGKQQTDRQSQNAIEPDMRSAGEATGVKTPGKKNPAFRPGQNNNHLGERWYVCCSALHYTPDTTPFWGWITES